MDVRTGAVVSWMGFMLSIDSLHLCIALGPLAVYLMLLGLLHISRRPCVTTGARDAATLGVAISGLVIAGPMDLFLPEPAANRFGAFVWLLLLVLFALSLTFIVLLLRPRIVIYNITAEQLRPVLAETVSEIDREARWAGESLVLPQLGVQLYLETGRLSRTAQLVSAGPRQDYVGWRKLERALWQSLRERRGSRNSLGFVYLCTSCLLISLITITIASNPEQIAVALREMLRM